MAYIDYTFYTDVYKGIPISEDAFSRLAERATAMINQLTNYTIQDLATLPPFTQEQVKRATAAQVEYFAHAGEQIVHGDNGMIDVRIGNFSYSSGANGTQSAISPAVINYLRPTGLLYRGVRVCD
ncbi:hypothetical protein ACPVTF_04145 [Geobacillus icigianus]|uniref:Protein gp8 n=1 Tax=Geobacillus subterraneus TaxID=129338 RepID=A0A679FQD1_9BACL|nr:hypothetical protein [Geobacillus subterraneus]BBW97229.1 hypothetical protein GsuE55_20620 [Geobacillus subterraneus]